MGVRRDRRREVFTTPVGKRRHHVLDANRLTLSFGGGRRVEVLAAADGIAYRLANLGDRTAWSAPAQSRAWLQSFRMDYEGPYQATALEAAAAGEYGFPALLAVPGGSYALLTEAGLQYRQAGSRMTVAAGRAGVLRLTLPPGEHAGVLSPWRVAIVGSLDTVVESDLPLSLGRPSEISDASWIAPGRSAWSWWSDSWSPRRVGHQQQFVDFAAEQSFEYNVVDEGWDAAWVRELADYGAGRGVRQILWTDWHALATAEQRRTVLDRWASWGVAGIKVDFLHADTASRLAVMEDIARAAAERRMVVNFHGCTVPRGLQRTWPNVLTMEGIAGAETGKGDNATDPVLNVNAAFTRNVIGSMDYTPVTLSTHRLTSAGHELAQSVVYESGIQHYADSPESYRAWPEVAAVIRDVPAAWDDTVMVDGAPDSFVTLARRSGESWFVGSLHAGAARTASVPLRFLPAGRTYDARITGDDGRGGLTASQRTVTAAETLQVPVGVKGGLVVTLRPAP